MLDSKSSTLWQGDRLILKEHGLSKGVPVLRLTQYTLADNLDRSACCSWLRVFQYYLSKYSYHHTISCILTLLVCSDQLLGIPSNWL